MSLVGLSRGLSELHWREILPLPLVGKGCASLWKLADSIWAGKVQPLLRWKDGHLANSLRKGTEWSKYKILTEFIHFFFSHLTSPLLQRDPLVKPFLNIYEILQCNSTVLVYYLSLICRWGN